MAPSLKNGRLPKIFFPIFSKNVGFLKKLLDDKIFKTSFPIKKVILIFVARCPPSLPKWVEGGLSLLLGSKLLLF